MFTCLVAPAAALPAAEQQPVRPLSTDRPDQTESAHTVPKGWFQVESNLVSFSRTYGMSEQAQDTSLCDFISLAILPWVKAPTATTGFGNNAWEYGLTINQELDIGGGWELGSSIFLAMAVTDERQRYFEPAFTLAIGRDLTEKLAFYVETYQGWLNSEERYLQSSFDGGLTYLVTPDLKFDVGMNWFFNGNQTLNPFVGVSFRF
ncbi:MAG: transporter [Verrucomicrobia bacterium]|nr:transporter [Verrucomicrobiota bacterium]